VVTDAPLDEIVLRWTNAPAQERHGLDWALQTGRAYSCRGGYARMARGR